MILEGQGHLGEFNKFPNLSAVPPPSPKRIKLFRNEVQEAEMAEYLWLFSVKVGCN